MRRTRRLLWMIPVFCFLTAGMVACSDDDDGAAEVDAGTTADSSTSIDSGTDQDSGTGADAQAGVCSQATNLENPPAGTTGHTEVAEWKQNRTAALAICFDDSTPNQALLGIPAMSSRGLMGTWFVNPNVQIFIDHQSIWEDAPSNGQELANHTMDHSGAVDYADAEFQIGAAAQIIWDIYPEDRSPLMAFNRGGNTTWNITDEEYQGLLEAYYCVERLHSSGVLAATPASTMTSQLTEQFTTGPWVGGRGSIHFHGICDPADTTNCVCDVVNQTSNCREYGNGTNTGAVSLAEFEAFLDFLVTDPFFSEQIWIGGWIALEKYEKARDAAQVGVFQSSQEAIGLCLTSSLDPALYDEPLTLMTEVPAGWASCNATQGGVSIPCRIDGDVAVLEAGLDRGDILVSP